MQESQNNKYFFKITEFTITAKIIIILSFLPLVVKAQDKETFNERTFFEQMKNSYYSLKGENITNFTVFATNTRIEKFATKNWQNDEIFPLQVIWFASDRVFLSEQGVPALTDTMLLKYKALVSDLKQQITGMIFDLKRFYLNGIYQTISPDYKLTRKKDVVEIKYTAVISGDTTNYTCYFGLNALCLKILTHNTGSGTDVETTPHFKITKTKWLCDGWQVQISNNGAIDSGFIISLDNKLQNDIWIPSEIGITVQQSKTPGITYEDKIYLKNFLFNQPLQIIEGQNKQ